MKRLIFALFFGLAGTGVLIALGSWQLQRLGWKQDVLITIERRISAPEVSLPVDPDPETAQYLPVTANGQLSDEHLRVLVSQKNIGAGYRIIRVLDTGTRRVLVDLGFLKLERATPAPSQGGVRVTGNLLWPQEVDSFTPAADKGRNIWFARDLQAMAQALSAEPVLIVARDIDPAQTPIDPLPIDGAGIPNDHLQYAITWFSLAAIWLGMTATFLWKGLKTRKGPVS